MVFHGFHDDEVYAAVSMLKKIKKKKKENLCQEKLDSPLFCIAGGQGRRRNNADSIKGPTTNGVIK